MLIVRTSLVAAVLAVVGGCAAVPNGAVTVPVPVSPAVSIAPPMPARPDLAISRIQAQTQPAEVVRLYRETVEQLASYSEQLETLLQAWQRGGK